MKAITSMGCGGCGKTLVFNKKTSSLVCPDQSSCGQANVRVEIRKGGILVTPKDGPGMQLACGRLIKEE